MKHYLLTGALVLFGGVAFADPPGNLLVGVTITLKSDSIDAYSVAGQISTVPISASAFGIAISPIDRPLILSNRLDYPSLRNVGKGRGGYEKIGRVQLPSRVISGYLMRTSIDPPIDFSSGTLSALQANRHFHLCTDLKKLHNPPFEDLVISTTNVACASIDPMSMVSIEHYAGPFDGWTKHFGQHIDPELIKFNDQRPPDYMCQDDQGYGATWISYNKNVGEKELKPLCDREAADPPNQVTDDERKAMLSKGSVFFFNFGYD